MVLPEEKVACVKSPCVELDRKIAEEYRLSEEAFCYKMCRTLGQSFTFPCYKNPDNELSRGCRICSRTSPSTPVKFQVEDFVLKKEDIDNLVKGRWKLLEKEKNMLTFEKNENSLSSDEFCFNFCDSIRPGFLSYYQTKIYELIRPLEKMKEDVMIFRDVDNEYYESVLSSTLYPKLAIAIGLAKKD